VVGEGRKRNAWGGVRKLPSGRYQAHYRVDRVWYNAPTTYRTKRDADIFLAATRADIERGTWINPNAGKITLDDYAKKWLTERPNLRPRTQELYEILLRRHINPVLGGTELSKLAPGRIRTWHANLVAAKKPGASTVAKAYRLLHAILQTAVQDELILKNPCVLRGASAERPAERPVATVAQVYALADAIEPQFRAMVLLATFTGLRLGEIRALRRRYLDLLHHKVEVVEQYQQLVDGSLIIGPPKTDAGRRTVAIPEAIVPELEAQLATFAASGKDGLVFAGTRGQPFRLATFYRAWRKATLAVGLERFHFHDLRHTGNTLAAATGASTKELMSRMGHASPRAALIYQHATQDRDAVIAAALSDVIGNSLKTSENRPAQSQVLTIGKT
jgi:integrase